MPFIVIMILFWLLLIRPQRREQTKREEMLKALKPNDRVITIGGIYGVVTNVHLEADMVTIRVDEKNDTKIRVTRGAIARILGEEAPGEPSK
jgi:preprotein translocase subunit YajC